MTAVPNPLQDQLDGLALVAAAHRCDDRRVDELLGLIPAGQLITGLVAACRHLAGALAHIEGREADEVLASAQLAAIRADAA
jgi:hypothetical protein